MTTRAPTRPRAARAARSVDVVAFGEALWDVTCAAVPPRSAARPWPFAGYPGGASANLAIVLARLGVGVDVVARVGDDFLGRGLSARLAAEKVGVRGLMIAPGRTGLTFVTRGEDGEPRYLNFRDGFTVPPGPKALPPWPGGARWLVVGSTHAARPEMRATTARACRLARAAGAHLAVDLNARRFGFTSIAARRRAVAWLIEHAALLKASGPDLDALGFRTTESARAWLARQAPRATLLLTAGGAGASSHGGHGSTIHAARPVRVVDAAGAGDAFLAGVLATLLASGAEPGAPAWSDPEIWTSALKVGHSLGRRVVSRVGGTTGAESLAAVRTFLARQKQRRRRS